MKYYLGVDGGGTRTTAAVTDENGNLIIKKSGKTINFYAAGMENSNINLKELMNEIYSQLGEVCFEAAFIGCSALDSRADEATITGLCQGAINANRIVMDSDVYIALKAVNSNICPCVVICGTGSMAIGEDEQGNTYTSGGWGHILGDEGSAYSIALNALKACCVACDKGESTALVAAANGYFELNDFRQIIDAVYAENAPKDVLAGFAANVGELAETGDEAAKAIIMQEADALADTVIILLEKVVNCSVLGLYGGVFQHNAAFTAAFTAKVNERFPCVKTQLLAVAPEECAAKLAREYNE